MGTSLLTLSQPWDISKVTSAWDRDEWGVTAVGPLPLVLLPLPLPLPLSLPLPLPLLLVLEVMRRDTPRASNLRAFSKFPLTMNFETPSMYGPTEGCSLTRKVGVEASRCCCCCCWCCCWC